MLIAALVLVALMLPGVLLCARLFPDWDRCAQRSIGAVAGMAFAVVLSSSVSYLALGVFPFAWIIVVLASIYFGDRTVLTFGIPKQREALLLAVVLIVAASRYWVSSLHSLPHGWDPAFHLLLTQKLLNANSMIFSWQPFEQIALHYPLGSHILVAILNQVSGLELPACFSILLVLTAVLSTLLVYGLSRRALGDSDAALYSATAYGLLALYGSIDYHRWGGLPTALGMLFCLAALYLLCELQDGVTWHRNYRFYRRLLLGVFCAATLYTHHHSTLTAGLLFLGLLCAPRVFDRKELLRELVSAAIVAMSFSLPELSLRFSQLGGLGNTSIFRFREPLLSPLAVGQSLGWVFLALCVVGLFLWRKNAPPQGRNNSICIGVLLVLFVVCGYLYPLFALYRFGQPFVLLTPSRFLTDAVYFLAIPVGFGIASIVNQIRLSPPIVIAILLVLGTSNFSAWRDLTTTPLPVERQEAYQWIAKNTKATTFVLDDNRWCSYLSWRVCRYTPIPISEPLTRDTEVQRYFRSLAKGVVPYAFAERAVVTITSDIKSVAPEKILWKHRTGLAVVQVWKAKASAQDKSAS